LAKKGPAEDGLFLHGATIKKIDIQRTNKIEIYTIGSCYTVSPLEVVIMTFGNELCEKKW
jgi:hypothetical protein